MILKRIDSIISTCNLQDQGLIYYTSIYVLDRTHQILTKFKSIQSLKKPNIYNPPPQLSQQNFPSMDCSWIVEQRISNQRYVSKSLLTTFQVGRNKHCLCGICSPCFAQLPIQCKENKAKMQQTSCSFTAISIRISWAKHWLSQFHGVIQKVLFIRVQTLNRLHKSHLRHCCFYIMIFYAN